MSLEVYGETAQLSLSFNCTLAVLMFELIPHLLSLNTRKDKRYSLLNKGLPNNFRIRSQARRLVIYVSIMS